MYDLSYAAFYEPLQEFVGSVFAEGEVVSEDFDIASKQIRLRSLHPYLIERLKPAISHLSLGDRETKADLVISLIDLSQLVDMKLPKIPWGQLINHGHRGFHVDGLYLQYVHILSTDVRILSVYNSKTNHAFYLVSDAKRLPWYISGAPMHEILYWWTRDQDMHILHSGVIGSDYKAVALLGAKGAGKSTLVLNALEYGFKYIAEDYCIVTIDQEPIAYSLYNSAKFTDYTFEHFPHFTRFRRNQASGKDKHLVYYREIYPDQLVNARPLSAFISPKLVKDAVSKLNSISQDQAFLDLISSTTLQNPIFETTSKTFFQKLSTRLPAYELVHWADTEQTLTLISEVME